MNNNHKQKVLIVDDSPYNLTFISSLLEQHYEIRIAENGLKALEIAKNETPDIILLDVIMPGIDGYETCKRFKEDDSLKHIPIIFLTSRNNTEDEQKGLDLGAVDYLIKPVSPPLLMIRVKNHLDLKMAQDILKDRNVYLEAKNRKFERIFQEESARYRALIESTDDLIWVVDSTRLGLLTFNSALSKYFSDNLNIDLRLGMTIKEIMPKEKVSEWYQMYTKAITEGPFKKEYYHSSKNKHFIFSFYPLLVDEEVIGVSVFGQDISDMKNTQLALMKESVRYHSLIESTNNMIWVVEPENYRVCLFNSSFSDYCLRRYGIKIKAGMGPNDILSEKRAKLFTKLYAKAIKEDRFKYNFQDKESDATAVLSFAPLKVNGKNLGISVFAENITTIVKYKEELEKSNKKLAKRFEMSIGAISKIGELRDVYTTGHQKRVKQLACAIAKELGLSQNTLNNISFGALIHDIGKLYVPSDILNKSGKLNELEYSILQTHSKYGYEVAKEMDFPWQIPTMIYQHHEKLDGTGYPQGLLGDEIIIESRILAVSDIVEAMSSHRPYRPALGIEAALEEILRLRGTKLDEEVVDICLKLFREKKFCFTT